jgi:hypothetical protein
MGKSTAFSGDWLNLIFKAVAIDGLAAPDGTEELYVSLHTGDVGDDGNQGTSEATYTGYARQAVSRDASGWTVAGNGVTNAADIVFGKCTGGSSTITHWAVGTDATGAGKVLYAGAFDDSLAVSQNIRPRIPAGELNISEE